jgi:8-oxo-dGTP pyrophosphatase MutT (NUDIX family)
MTTIQPIRPAATVILVRDVAAGFEIFMLRRTSAAAFAGGMYVFPGGRVDGDDHLHAYDPWRVGPSEAQRPQQRALGDEWRGYWIAGIRESFEEAGLLLAYDAQGNILAYPDADSRARFHAYRDPLHAGELTLADICAREGLRLAVDRIHFLNRFVTPFGRPRRFDTRFFVAAAPPGQTGVHDAVETVDSVWISPAEALARHEAREFDLMRVTRMQLEMLADFASLDALMHHVSSRQEFAIHRPQVGVDG